MYEAPRWTAATGWTPHPPREEGDPNMSGLRVARGALYGVLMMSILVFAVTAILWWAL